MIELDGNKTIEQLFVELQAARLKLEEAIEQEKAIDHRLTDARNVFNGITKKLDAAYKKLRESAPWNTEWHSAEHKGGAV
jgi:hypothetical protein